jgi:hypothetical protein
MDRVLLNKLACSSAALLVIALCNGCASGDLPQNGAAPSGNDPGPPVMGPVTTVDSLRPTFAWTRSKQLGILMYELKIWLAVPQRDGTWSHGKEALSCTGIWTNTYTLAKPLAPDTVYVWSVRSWAGKKKSAWAAFDDGDPTRSQKGRRGEDIFFPFKTPGK